MGLCPGCLKNDIKMFECFEHFYGVISMVYKTVDHRKLWLICFLQWLFCYERPKTKEPALRDMLHFYTVIDHSCQWISAGGFAQLL